MTAFLVPHAVLLIAAAALADAAWRLARTAASGADAVLAAATVWAAAAAGSALALGLVALGGSPVALTAAALALFAAARRWLPDPEPTEIPRLPLAAGAAAGAGLAWTAWVARHPGLGVDTLTYHLPESVLWAQSGEVGAIRTILDDFPVGNYPVTNEVLVAWTMGVAGSLAPALAWTPLMAALFAVAGVTALRRLGATPAAAGLAVAAVLLVPIAAAQHIGPHTDLPALAWLAVTAALVAADRPRLLPFALLAGALAVGTKTTMAPLGLLVLAVGLHRHRRHLPWRALAAAAVAGTAVGGVWYLRNAVLHGSPLWPFASGPWGDPPPPLLELIDVAFLDRPVETLRGRLDVYFLISGGAVLVLLAGIGVALLRRRGLVIALSAAAALAALIWASAPFTGKADNPLVDFSLTTVRYLLPAIATAAAALAVARHRLATGLLAVAAAVSLVKALQLDFPMTPGAGTLAVGAVAGAAAARWLHRVPAVAWAAATVVALAVSADGLPQRHARASIMPSGPVIKWVDARAGDEPIASSYQMLGVLAGDDLRRGLAFIPRGASCREVLGHAEAGWVLIGTPRFDEAGRTEGPLRCLSAVRPVYSDPDWRVYRRR